MIAYLTGIVQDIHEKSLTLNVHDVGYLVHSPRRLLEKLHTGDTLALYIHTNVREDDLSLFGLETKDEWQFFKLLLSVSGIGPKSALEILNSPMDKVRRAIAKRDVAMLTQTPGIGKKTAERMIVDLQGKIKEELLEEDTAESGTNVTEDIVLALVSLGYQRHQVTAGLKKIPAEISGESAIIKYFLQNV